MSTFLIIPEKGTKSKYFIRMVDIINLIDNNTSTQVTYKCGDRVCSIYTLLTGEDIHEVMKEIEAQNTIQFFDFGTGGEE